MKCKNCNLEITWDEVLGDYTVLTEIPLMWDMCSEDEDGAHEPLKFSDYAEQIQNRTKS